MTGVDAKRVDVKAANITRSVLDALTLLYPSLRSYSHRPVRDYATFLYGFKQPNHGVVARSHALEKLLATLTRAARRAGLSAEAALSICSEFARRPVLQTGPHLMLSIDPDAYYTHLFSLLGLLGQGSSSYVSYAVSTVSLAERSTRGPGWTSVNGKLINLFGMSQSQLKSQSLLSRAGPYRLQLKGDSTLDLEGFGRLRDILPCAEYETPASAIRAANRALWPNVFSRDVTMLQIDDEDIADLVIDHIIDESSWLRQRLFERHDLAERIIKEVNGLAGGSWAGWLSRGTDFFWHYKKGRRRPLRLTNGNLVDPSEGTIISTFAPEDICLKLKSRTLIPNLLLMFLVAAILPGVRVLGGSRHPIYYPLMRFAWTRALYSCGIDGDLINSLAADILPGAWGHRVIEGGWRSIPKLLDEPVSGNLWKSDLSETPVFAACGSMDQFTSDPLWIDLVSALSAGAVCTSDPEWTYAGDAAAPRSNAFDGFAP